MRDTDPGQAEMMQCVEKNILFLITVHHSLMLALLSAVLPYKIYSGLM